MTTSLFRSPVFWGGLAAVAVGTGAYLHHKRGYLLGRSNPAPVLVKRNPAKMPPAIKRQIEDNDQQQAGQRRFIADKDAERKRVHMKFDEELDQLRRLWTLQAPGGAASGTK